MERLFTEARVVTEGGVIFTKDPVEFYNMLRHFITEEEREAGAFRNLGERVDNARTRSLLLTIASDADRHAQTLRKIYESVQRDEFIFEGFFPIEPDVMKLLRDHIRKEEAALDFYEKMASDSANQSIVRLMFAELAADERRHHASMEIVISLVRE